MRFASLGSGSQGNALVVEAGGTRVLVDCGFSCAAIARRLVRLGLAPDDLDAIILTHEHSDHVGSAAAFSARHRLPVYLTAGTLAAAALENCAGIVCIDTHTPFAIDGIEIHPYTVPHDAREPCQFVFGDGVRRIGLLTDTGRITPHVREMLTGCDALLIECNYDPQMLAQGPYPPFLKARVDGDFGHLSNAQAAELLAFVATPRLRHVAAMHISRHNNTPPLAAATLAGALGCPSEEITLACQGSGFDWRTLG